MRITSTPPILTADDLSSLNERLPWYAGTSLSDGRLLGNLDARPGKRDALQAIPDKRIVRLEKEYGLEGKRVLEVGCFEGIHTVGLCGAGADVTAVDIRIWNVIKTAARVAAYGFSARTAVVDVEAPDVELPRYDLVFHCGVLYHLEDPVSHLGRLLPRCDAIYLDTHVVTGPHAPDRLTSQGRIFAGIRQTEGGWTDPYSGRAAHAFWLQQTELVELLERAGFQVEVWSQRDERNGPRVGLFARRAAQTLPGSG